MPLPALLPGDGRRDRAAEVGRTDGCDGHVVGQERQPLVEVAARRRNGDSAARARCSDRTASSSGWPSWVRPPLATTVCGTRGDDEHLDGEGDAAGQGLRRAAPRPASPRRSGREDVPAVRRGLGPQPPSAEPEATVSRQPTWPQRARHVRRRRAGGRSPPRRRRCRGPPGPSCTTAGGEARAQVEVGERARRSPRAADRVVRPERRGLDVVLDRHVRRRARRRGPPASVERRRTPRLTACRTMPSAGSTRPGMQTPAAVIAPATAHVGDLASRATCAACDDLARRRGPRARCAEPTTVALRADGERRRSWCRRCRCRASRRRPSSEQEVDRARGPRRATPDRARPYVTDAARRRAASRTRRRSTSWPCRAKPSATAHAGCRAPRSPSDDRDAWRARRPRRRRRSRRSAAGPHATPPTARLRLDSTCTMATGPSSTKPCTRRSRHRERLRDRRHPGGHAGPAQRAAGRGPALRGAATA